MCLRSNSQILVRMEVFMDKYDRCKGGLYGLLVGDALGVPYEFILLNKYRRMIKLR